MPIQSDMTRGGRTIAAILILSCVSCGGGRHVAPADGAGEGDALPDGADATRDPAAETDAPWPTDGGEEACPPDRKVCEGVCCAAGERCAGGACCPGESACGAACCDAEHVCMGGLCHLACEGGTRCLDEEGDEICCAAGTICFMSSCVTPGAACTDDGDCALDEYCEAAVGKCLPIPDSDCEYRPPPGEFNPVVEWRWPPEGGTTVRPQNIDVLAPPVVGDMDGDGMPEVAFVAYDDACGASAGSYSSGLLTILRGDTGEEVLRLDDTARRLGAAPAPALGDLDGDTLPEVVVLRANFKLLAYKVDGTLLWESDQTVAKGKLAGLTTPWGGGIGIADLDADGSPEVFLGGVVFDSAGRFLWAGSGGMAVAAAAWGVANGSFLSTAADLDGDGRLELVGGNTAYQDDGAVYWTNAAVGDGFPGVADLFDAYGAAGKDGVPEVVLVRAAKVYVLDGRTGATVWGPHAIPGSTAQNNGGSPTIADFDGDTLAEIGTAGGAYMAVFDPDGATPLLWSKPTKDTSSAVTGSTVFDFEGDGVAEIVYTDECFVHIYSGPDGAILFKDSNNTRTANEFPLLVDVDADGNAELVVTANECVWDCETFTDWTGPKRRGVRVYGDALRNWVRTRAVWNEHTYHVTNVADDGTIPAVEPRNWETAGLNNFRQNVQTWGVHNAPDLTPELFGADMRWCSDNIVTLGVMVVNRGSKGVPAGVPVGFYEVREGGERAFIGSETTAGALLPGMSEYVEHEWSIPPEAAGKDEYSFVVVVDDPSLGEAAFHECDEGNNEAGPVTVECVPFG